MATNNVINANATTPLIVTNGGTGANTLTSHSLLLGNGTSAVSALGAATDGQIPIGSTGSAPVLATLTAGTNITITPGPGTITIDASGGGGGGITTLDGNSGSATGSTVTFDSTSLAGSSTAFTGSGSTVQFSVEDTNSNTFIGNASGNLTGTGGQNTGFGHGTMLSFTSASANTAIGYNALLSNADAPLNVALGNGALQAMNTGGGNNTALGTSALLSLTNGSSNIAIGVNAGNGYGGGESNNILIGSSGVALENGNIRLGDPSTQTGCYIAGIGGITPSGTPQTVIIDPVTGQMGSTSGGGGGGVQFIDGDSGSSTGVTISIKALSAGATTQFFASGTTVSLTMEDGSNNIVIGNGTSVGASDSIGIGNSVFGNASSTNQSVAIGSNSQNGGGGNRNTSVGYNSLNNSAFGGDHNTVIGALAGSAYASGETSNILLGNVGVASESHTIHIGTEGSGAGQQNTCFIAGIANATVTGSPVLVDTSTGQLGLAVSSERFKQNIKDMGDKSSAVMKLRPVTFSYKQDATNAMQYGLIAEEAADTMPHIVTYDAYGQPYTIRYHDLPSILLNELQKLSKRVEELEAKLADKE